MNKKNKSLALLVQKTLNLNKSSSRVLVLLELTPFLSVNELVKELSLDRTTIQKLLNSLVEKGLIARKQLNLNRGYCFVYHNTIDLTEHLLSQLYQDLAKKVDLVVSGLLSDKKLEDQERHLRESEHSREWLDFERDKLK